MKTKSSIVLTSLIASIFYNTEMKAQSKEPIVRLAKIIVAPEKLDDYKNY